jgi:hypothetical protein
VNDSSARCGAPDVSGLVADVFVVAVIGADIAVAAFLGN